MSDYEVIIIGGGPAGLSAALYLARARRRTILLSEGMFSSPVADLEAIENYPGFMEPPSGSQLMSAMVSQVLQAGVSLEEGKVISVDKGPAGFVVVCADGREVTGEIVIVASGSSRKMLGVPGEERLVGKGVFFCAMCDGEKLRSTPVAVCGGGDAGVTEAIYMSRIASEVTLLEVEPRITASAILEERLRAAGNVKVICGARVVGITGGEQVEGVQYSKDGVVSCVEAKGVLVRIGLVPNTGFVKELAPLDETLHVVVDERMETPVAGLLAAGDVRSGSPGQIVTACGDGATAAISAEHLLQTCSADGWGAAVE